MTDFFDDHIYSIDQISALMYVKHISLRKMSRLLGIESSRLHSMLKYKDEKHNKLLRIACTWVLNMIQNSDDPEKLRLASIFAWDNVEVTV